MICYVLILISIFFFIRKTYFWSLLIFFFLLLDGFQVIPLAFLTAGYYSGATIDAALFIFLGLFAVRGKKWISHPVISSSLSKVIFAFIFILLLNMGYGLSIGYAFGDVFKGARFYLFLMSFLMFTEVPLKVIYRLINVFIVIAFFQSILFLLQLVVGHTILQGPKELVMADLNYTRYFNSPKLIDFSLAICLFWYPQTLNKRIRPLLIAVFVLAVLAPLHRGYMFAWLFSLGLYSLLFNNYKRKILYIFLIFISITIAFSVEILRTRILEAMDQLSIVSDIFASRPVYVNSTFVYRVNHLIERLTFINKDDFGWLFGIGLIDEKAPQVHNLPFQYGLPDPVTGLTVKVYTPDLVWSLLILTMGYVGGFLYVNIYIRILTKYSGIAESVDIYKVVFLLIFIGFLGSFTSNTLLLPFYFVPILLLIMTIEKRRIIPKHNTNSYAVSNKVHHHLNN